MTSITVNELRLAITSNEKETSKHLTYNVRIDFGFQSIEQKHHRILLDLYSDMIFNCNVTLKKLQYYASEGLLQQFAEKIYPTTVQELTILATFTFPNDVASVISEYACTIIWDTFSNLNLTIENPHGDITSCTSNFSKYYNHRLR
jgi:hypothetical protein